MSESKQGRRVLVVDDEANMRRVLEIMLARRGFRTLAAANGAEALELIAEQTVDLVISDLRMPGLDGIEFLGKLREAGNAVPLIVITAHGTIESAVEAMRTGACDYLLRPFDIEALDLAMQRVFNTREVLQQKDFLRDELDRNWHGLIGKSREMQSIRAQILQLAPTRASVLLTGETGTGKEVVARAIHNASDRKDELFVPINCAAIPAELLESELFGHEKGAFTGATKQRIGKFELAQGGTILLDEITEMPVALQSKLLRVLQENELQRVGGDATIELDVRIIAASNKNIRKAIAEQSLREDLYFRLKVFELELPPLRDRHDDIALLAAHFIGVHGRPGVAPAKLSAEALQALQAYRWPGNVRELGNLIERALIIGSGDPELRASHFFLENEAAVVGSPGSETPHDLILEPAVEAVETKLIQRALELTDGNKARAAQKLQISERSLWYKIKKYRLS